MDITEIMNNPNFPSILTLISTVIGACIGAVLGVIIPNHLRSKSDDRLFRKNKLELLYDDINNWFNATFSVIVLNFYLVIDKKMDWNGYINLIKNTDFEKEKVFFKSEIIISLYFKELETDFINLTQANQGINKYISNDIRNAYFAGDDILIFKTNFHAKVTETIALAERLKNHIKEIAQKI
jgi:hypothetical protein